MEQVETFAIVRISPRMPHILFRTSSTSAQCAHFPKVSKRAQRAIKSEFSTSAQCAHFPEASKRAQRAVKSENVEKYPVRAFSESVHTRQAPHKMRKYRQAPSAPIFRKCPSLFFVTSFLRPLFVSPLFCHLFFGTPVQQPPLLLSPPFFATSFRPPLFCHLFFATSFLPPLFWQLFSATPHPLKNLLVAAAVSKNKKWKKLVAEKR